MPFLGVFRAFLAKIPPLPSLSRFFLQKRLFLGIAKNVTRIIIPLGIIIRVTFFAIPKNSRFLALKKARAGGQRRKFLPKTAKNPKKWSFSRNLLPWGGATRHFLTKIPETGSQPKIGFPQNQGEDFWTYGPRVRPNPRIRPNPRVGRRARAYGAGAVFCPGAVRGGSLSATALSGVFRYPKTGVVGSPTSRVFLLHPRPGGPSPRCPGNSSS